MELAWRNVSISYRVREGGGSDRVKAVDDVTLTVPSGGTVGIAGESGSGKSTLAMSVLRLLPKSARIDGEILLDGESVDEMTFGRLRAVRWTSAAIVFQGAMNSLNPVHRVRRQIDEALRLHSRDDWADDASRNRRIDELLALVDLPRGKANAFPHELSGGQKQRVMIAMALACDPDIIVADEPTTALDVIVQAQVLSVLTSLVAERGLSLLMISHDLSVLAATCEHLVIMQGGRIIEQGPSRQIMAHPEHEHTKALAAAFPTIGDPGSRLRVGRAGITSTTREFDEADEHGVLEVRDLVVDFSTRDGTVRAVDHVSLRCRPGEIVALVGQSGSGKTTLARTILGLQPPTSGEVRYAGAALPRKGRELKRYRREVQFVPQDPAASLNPKLTVYESVAEGLRIQGLAKNERERVARALVQAELEPPERFFGAIPQELSGGQRQRVVIAGALALDPTFLVADEPVASLDASVRGEVLALLLNLKNTLDVGALVITHDLGLAWNIADRVLVMHRGRIVEEGSVEQVLLEPQHEYTKALLSVVPSAVARTDGGFAEDGIPAVLSDGGDPVPLDAVPLEPGTAEPGALEPDEVEAADSTPGRSVPGAALPGDGPGR